MAGGIVFNGKTYNSVDEMPPDIRQAYEQVMGIFADKNQNGMPDLFEGMGAVNPQNLNLQGRSTAIIYDSKKYDSVEQLPPEARQKYEQAMGRLDVDRNGIPDLVENIIGMSSASNPTSSLPSSQPTYSQAPAVPASPPAAIEPENNSLRWLIIGVGLAVILCLGAMGFWVWFGR